ESLWALNLSGGLDDALALETLHHPDPYVRLWTVRLLGDQRFVSSEIGSQLAELAGKEGHVEVRSQLACSARRLPAREAMAIVRKLFEHTEDVQDGHLPL